MSSQTKILLSIITFFAYLSIISFEFVAGDDFLRIIGINELNYKGIFDYIFTTMPERPALLLSMYIDYLIADKNAVWFKFISIILHLCNGLIVNSLVNKFNKAKFNITDSSLGFFIALLFLIIPINTQVVIVVIQRGVILSTLFGLLYILFLNKFYKQRDRKFYFLSILLFYLSVLSKPNSFVFIILCYFYVSELNNIKLKNYLKENIPHVLIYIYPVLMFKLFERDSYVVLFYTPIEYFTYQISNYFIYIKQTIYPFDLRFYHNYDVENVYVHIKTILSVIGHLFLNLYFYFKNKKYYGLFLAIYIVMMPESSFFPIIHSFFEHRFYVATIFLIWLFILSIKNLKNKNLIVFIVSIFFIVSSNLHGRKVNSKFAFNYNSLKYVPDDIALAASLINDSFDSDNKRERFQKIEDVLNFKNQDKELEKIFKDILKFDSSSNLKRKKLIEKIIFYLNSHKARPGVDWLYVYSLLFERMLIQKLPYIIKDKTYYLYLLEKAMRKVTLIISRDTKYYQSLVIKHVIVLKNLLSELESKKIIMDKMVFGGVLGQLECYKIKHGRDLSKLNQDEKRSYNFFKKNCR